MQVSRFDEAVDREGTGALAFARQRYGMPPDVVPLWVADMAFRMPETIALALADTVRHGIIGYAVPTDGYYDSLAGWFERRHGWTVDPRASIQTRGVVHALYLIVDALTTPGDGVLIQPPVYAPFFEAIRRSGRRLL
ncbi:MAG: aminotransferase, partial [Bifidobacteriaceae bacterium]|nr:aminotransferase [Bifidobacteriaceae bacterium]